MIRENHVVGYIHTDNDNPDPVVLQFARENLLDPEDLTCELDLR